MSALSIQPTFPIFTETDGLPLENGYIWIGAANLDPQGNPISVYWDAALTIPAGQPIRTLNGYPSRSGTPARIYVNSDYSIRVQDSKGSLVYSAADGATDRFSSEQVSFLQSGTGATSRTAQDKMRDVISVKDFGAVGDGVTDDSAAIAAAIVYASTVSTARTNPLGGTHPTASVFFPAGIYLVTQNNWIGANLQVGSVFGGRFDLTFEGVGRNTSVILFKPNAANGACYDQTLTPNQLLNGFSVNHLGFYFNDTANGTQPIHFIRSLAVSAQASQNWRLFDCKLTGVVGSRLFWLASVANVNEDVISVYDTLVSGFENVVFSPSNLEAVIHSFYSLDCLGQRGSVFKYNTGGSLQVDSLQCIMDGTAGVDTAILELTGGTTTRTYRLNNVRTELRGANTRLFLMTLACENTVVFSNSEVSNVINNQAWAKAPVQHHAMITFKDCILPPPDPSVTGALGTKGTFELTDSLSGADFATVAHATSCITFENCATFGDRRTDVTTTGLWVDFSRLTVASANFRTCQIAYKGCINFPDCTEFGFARRMGRSFINRTSPKLEFRGEAFPGGDGISAPVVRVSDFNALIPLNNFVTEIVVMRKALSTAATNYQIEFIDTAERNVPGSGVIFGATAAVANNTSIAQRVIINRLFTGTLAQRTVWARMAAGFTLGVVTGNIEDGGIYAEVV